MNDWTQPSAAKLEPVGMAVVHEINDDEAVVHVFGEVDLANVGDFERELTTAALGDGLIAVDFRACQYIDSSVLSALVRAHKMLGARLRIITGKSGNVTRLLGITKLDAVLRIDTIASSEI